ALCLLVADSGRGPFTALAAARTGARRVFGPSLVTAVDDSVLVATAVHARDVRRRLGDFAATVRAELELATTGRFVVSAGPLVDELAELDRSVAAARETAVLARRLSPSAETVLADDFALYQLIAGLVEDAALERFVDEQIGPLLEFDARTGAELV